MSDEQKVDLGHSLQSGLEKGEARKAREDQKMVSIAKKLATLGDDYLMEAMGFRGAGRRVLTEQVPMEMQDDSYLLPEEQEALRTQQRMPQRRQFSFNEQVPLTEDAPAPRRAPKAVQDTSWTVKQYMAETKSGANIPVWKVFNSKIGMEHQTPFRIEEVAVKIANILNESGNFNDPRVVSVINAYTKRDKLLKECRALEQEVKSKGAAAADSHKAQRVRQLRSEIQALEYRLGI